MGHFIASSTLPLQGCSQVDTDIPWKNRKGDPANVQSLRWKLVPGSCERNGILIQTAKM